MISISLNSGITPRSARALAPSREAASPAGTSSSASRYAFFPGDDFSKINPSFWLTCVVAFFGVPMNFVSAITVPWLSTTRQFQTRRGNRRRLDRRGPTLQAPQTIHLSETAVASFHTTDKNGSRCATARHHGQVRRTRETSVCSRRAHLRPSNSHPSDRNSAQTSKLLRIRLIARRRIAPRLRMVLILFAQRKPKDHAVAQLNRQRVVLFQRRRRNCLADLRAQRVAILRLAERN